MRFICFPLPFFLLCACNDRSASSTASEPEPEPKVSFSREVRPALMENCLTCHADLPLHNLEGWDLLHTHEEEIETPMIIKKWIMEGSKVDPHWATQPLRKISAASVDDFLKSSSALETEREVPKPMFTASIPDLLAGDLMEDPARAVSTGYLRRGEDTPEWRAEMVAQEFLGMNIACARCHDHPSENWTTARYHSLANLFTTPYDHTPSTLAPIHISVSPEQSQTLASLKDERSEAAQKTPPSESDYLAWLNLDEGSPSLPGLVAAYSFEEQGLDNLAMQSSIRADGYSLIAEESAHGAGLLFNKESELILSGHAIQGALDRFTISAWIKMEDHALSDTAILRIGTHERGFELRIVEGKLRAQWARFSPQVGIAVTSQFPLIAPDRWSHIALSYDGSRQASGFQIYLNGLPIAVIEAPSQLRKTALKQKEPLIISGQGLSLDELQIYNEDLTPIGIRQVFDGRALALAYQNRDNLREFYQRHYDQKEDRRRQQIRALNEAILQSEDSAPAYLVMASKPKQQGHNDPEETTDRLEFVKQLNSDLMARSLANEVWRRHFGQPLAPSLGLSDPPPAHGDLLEWLAGELKGSNFHVGKLGSLIRASQTWKQEWQAPESDTATCPRKQAQSSLPLPRATD